MPLCTQLQMRKTVRKLSVFPFICCKSTYKDHISFSQILLYSLLKFTPYLLQSSPNFTWEKSKLRSKGYTEVLSQYTRSLCPLWQQPPSSHKATACSGVSAVGCTSHQAFKSQHHEASQDITLHCFQPSAVCATKDEDQELKQSVYNLHACNN